MKGDVLRGGTILEAVGGTYRVRLDDGDSELKAFLRGRLKREARTGERIVPGDRVRVLVEEGGSPTVEEVLPRASELVRAGPGGRRPKLVAANVDRILVVLSASDPPFRPETADRFLVMAESSGIPPVLVINKIDLAPYGSDVRRALEPVVRVYRQVGYAVLETSTSNGEGIDALADLLSAGASVLVGPSGVGKSSLLNAINPALNLRTRGVSVRGGRGRHTTVGARLLHLKGEGWVVDTPGFSDVALWGIDPARLPDAFPEFRERAGECRFRSCRHLEEPGCAVKQALDRGEVDEGRHRSYRILAEEADQLPSW